MRSIGLGLAASVAVVVLTLANSSVAQPPPQPEQPGGDQPASGATLTLGSTGASAATTDPQRDEAPQPEDEEKADAEEKLPWRGTVLIFDQAATTQTVGIGKDYNSYNPSYELSFSLRPRYYLFDDGTHTINVNARLDVSQELTNSDETTQEQEMLLGNTWLNFVYGVTVYKDVPWVTQISTGPRFIFPTAKASYMSGERLQLGWVAGVQQGLPLAGDESTWFPTAALQASGEYRKFLREATTGVNDDFNRERQDFEGRTLVSDQISTGAKVNHQVTALTSVQVDVTEKLHVSGSYIWIMQWTHKFENDTEVPLLVGTAIPDRLEDPQNYRVLPWFMAGIDYDVIPEMGLGVGYYNLTNQIGEDGQRRNPLWSPDARVTFTITANLDEIYKTAAGRGKSSTAAEAQEARVEALKTGLSF